MNYNGDNLFESAPSQSAPTGHVIRVAFESGVDGEFDYSVPDELWPVKVGQRVAAPFGRVNKIEEGFCVAEQAAGERAGRKFKLKRVLKVLDDGPLVDADLMELARWMSSYYVCPLGQVLAAVVPAAVKKGSGSKTERYVYLNQTSDLRPETSDSKSQATTHDALRTTYNEIKGKKQRQIVDVLIEKGALGADTAIELDELLAAAGCTEAPVKRLAENMVVKIVQRTVLKSLPAIPAGLTAEPGEIILNEDQQNAMAHFNSQIDSGRFGVTLLHGVTDSGKTEIYIRAIDAVLRKGRTAIVLLPEIALTAQTVQRFSSRFEKIAVMHSGLTAAQRNVQWQKIKAGQADVVIGARSAVFAPLSRLGLVVVDEEHEPSYKQDTAPRYHGRDAAIKRAQLADAHCILGSATPSLETLLNCSGKKHFSLIRLPKRVMDLPMPEMRLVDLRKEFSQQKGINLISKPLADHLAKVLSRGEQAILLLNRRGYSNLVLCPSCKQSLRCRNCDVTLTFHKSKPPSKRMETVLGSHIDSGHAQCHYCGAQTLVLEKCPLCGTGLVMIGLGSQRLEEELIKKFPKARIARIDSDSMAGKDYYKLLRDFGDGKIDILAGTQMLAKGLHFPNVTAVGIISADTCLYLPDFRSNERTFQLISQVAGRAGRSAKKGTVFIQTFLADQPAIQFALKNDYKGFVEEELKHRKGCNLPPFWRMAVVVMRDMSFEKLETACADMRKKIGQIIEQNDLKVVARGPVPAIISRIQRFHRMQILIQSADSRDITQLFAFLRQDKVFKSSVKVAIDMDPVNLL